MNFRHHACILLGSALTVATALSLGSCSDENPWAGAAGEGRITLHLTADPSVTDAAPSTRADGDLFAVPSAGDFKVRLSKSDGSYDRTWNSLAEFSAEESFPTGAYTLTAFYGDSETEGFEAPWFVGEERFSVLEAQSSEVEVTARLANSLVSVTYTDAFRSYFRSWSARLHSEGHSYVDYPAEESRPAFIAPGNVDLSLDLVRPDGKSVTVQPASFAAVAATHYHVTVDVNSGNVGAAQLEIRFDDSLTLEDVTVDLTDELFSTPAPKVVAKGFTPGESFDILSGESAEGSKRFNVIAYGGLQEVMMTIASADFTPAFGHEVNLMTADPAVQAQIRDLGIDVRGIFNNPDRMAYVDVTALPAHLPEGEYEISICAKDNYLRQSEPVAVKFSASAVTAEVEPQAAVFGSNVASLQIDYNGSDPRADFSFKALDRHGAYKDCPVTDVQLSTRTRAIETKRYIFTITLPDTERESIPVKVYLKGREHADVSVPVILPEFTLDADPFARRVALRVNATGGTTSAITNMLHIYDAQGLIDESRISRYPETGVITVSGFEPSTAYTLSASLLTTRDASSHSVSVTTEAATALANGNFSATHDFLKDFEIQVGGEYRPALITYTNWSKISVSEPDGWATVNQKTCWTGAANINTWFCVPSTMMSSGAVTLRNVAYDHNGTTPARDKGTTGWATSENRNVPTFTTRAAGELFLGSYSFDGTEHRVDGIAFASRPTSVSFDYSYSPIDGDTGVATIELIAADGTSLGSATLDLTASATSKRVTMTVPSYRFGLKAAKMRLGFKSSKGSAPTHTPTGDELDEASSTLPVTPYKHWLDTNSYHAFASGSVLTIDNVTLNY